MKKKIVVISVVSVLTIIIAIIGYFNVITPIAITGAEVTCFVGEKTDEEVYNVNEAYKKDSTDNYTIVHYINDGVITDNPKDYRLVRINVTFKNRSFFEKRNVNYYISEIEHNNIALYSNDAHGALFVTTPCIAANSENAYSMYLTMYIKDCSEDDIRDVLESITLYCVSEGEYTGRREMYIKLSELCDLSKVNLGE